MLKMEMMESKLSLKDHTGCPAGRVETKTRKLVRNSKGKVVEAWTREGVDMVKVS